MLTILFKIFGFLALKDFTIIWLSNILILSVPDESFSRNALCALNFISKILLVYSVSQIIFNLMPHKFTIFLAFLRYCAVLFIFETLNIMVKNNWRKNQLQNIDPNSLTSFQKNCALCTLIYHIRIRQVLLFSKQLPIYYPMLIYVASFSALSIFDWNFCIR